MHNLHDFIKVVKKNDRLPEVAKQLEKLTQKAVYVGVPDVETNRQGGGITNAELAYIHTEGSPHNNIPARPFIIPAVTANKDDIGKFQLRALKLALSGQDVMPGLHALGGFASDCIRKWWDDPRNGWAPNAPSTIAQKGSSHPLINTTQLKNSVTYVIRNA